MLFSTPITNAQAPTASSTPNVIVVAGVKARDKWLKDLCEVGGTMQLLEFRTAVRLGLYFNCTTGQCNPTYSELARAVGARPDSVKKVCRFLKAGGWIRRNDGTGNFELLVQATGVSSGDTPRNQAGVSQKASRGVPNTGGGVSFADSLMNTENTENTEQSTAAPPPCASVLADRPVSSKLAVRESTPVGALDVSDILHDVKVRFNLSSSQAEPVRNMIKDALNIMPRDFVVTHIYASPTSQDFLASIASAGVAVTAIST